MFILRNLDGDGAPGPGGGADAAPAPIAGAMNKGGSGPEPKAADTFKVPDTYAKEEWAKNIKGVEDLFNQFANSQKLLGKKGVIVPGEKATPQEIAEFHKALGVPEKEEEYKFQMPEGVAADENEDKTLRTLMKKHGISKKAAEGLVADYRASIFEGTKAEKEKAAALDAEFDRYLDNIYGPEKSAKISQFKEVVKKTLDPKFHALIGKMDNSSALLLAGLVENIHAKYGKEGTFLDPKGVRGGMVRTQAVITQELTALHTKYLRARPQTSEYQEYVAQEEKLKNELTAVLSKK